MELARNLTDGLKGLFSHSVLTKTEEKIGKGEKDYEDENDSIEKISRSCSVDSGFGDELAEREDNNNNNNNNNNSSNSNSNEEAVISLEEVSEHNSPEDGWVVVGNYVYDVTHYLHKVWQ